MYIKASSVATPRVRGPTRSRVKYAQGQQTVLGMEASADAYAAGGDREDEEGAEAVSEVASAEGVTPSFCRSASILERLDSCGASSGPPAQEVISSARLCEVEAMAQELSVAEKKLVSLTLPEGVQEGLAHVHTCKPACTLTLALTHSRTRPPATTTLPPPPSTTLPHHPHHPHNHPHPVLPLSQLLERLHAKIEADGLHARFSRH